MGLFHTNSVLVDFNLIRFVPVCIPQGTVSLVQHMKNNYIGETQ